MDPVNYDLTATEMEQKARRERAPIDARADLIAAVTAHIDALDKQISALRCLLEMSAPPTYSHVGALPRAPHAAAAEQARGVSDAA